MTTLVASGKNQTRLVVRFPANEFESLAPMVDRFGGPQMFGERLVRWFAGLDPMMQTAIQGQVPASPDLAQLILRRMLAGQPPGHRKAFKAAKKKPPEEAS